MKTNMSYRLPAAVITALCLAGCTQVIVTKVPSPNAHGAPAAGDDTVGIRYSLPKPFVQMTPQADGSVTAEIVMLPDADNTYAVHAKSYVATHSLTVGVERGLLKKIAWTGNTADAAAQGVLTAGTIAGQDQALENTAAEADRAKTETARNDAVKQVRDTKLALDQAAAALALLYATYATPGEDAVYAAQLALQQAQIKHGAAVEHLSALEQSGAVANLPTGNDGTKKKSRVFGPVLYAVNETAGVALSLKPACDLGPYSVVDLPQDEAKPPTLMPRGLIALRADKRGNIVLGLNISSPIKGLLAGRTELSSGGVAMPPPPVAEESSVLLKVTLNGYAPGDYELKLVLDQAGTAGPVDRIVTFRILN